MAKNKNIVQRAIDKVTHHPSGATADIPAETLEALNNDPEMIKAIEDAEKTYQDEFGAAPQLAASSGTHGKRYEDHPKFSKFKGEK